MPGRIQFNTLKPETAPLPARFLEWVRQRYRSLMALLGGAEKPAIPRILASREFDSTTFETAIVKPIRLW